MVDVDLTEDFIQDEENSLEPIKKKGKDNPKQEAGSKKKALEVTFAQIDKQYGAGAVMMLGQAANMKIDAVTTGSILIDQAIGVGGFPVGRIIEIFGPESSGKTTLALHAIAHAQKN